MRKTVTEIIEIIKNMKNLNNDYEVADSIGVSRGALANAKRRNSMSFIDELGTFVIKKTYRWILSGKLPRALKARLEQS